MAEDEGSKNEGTELRLEDGARNDSNPTINYLVRRAYSQDGLNWRLKPLVLYLRFASHSRQVVQRPEGRL